MSKSLIHSFVFAFLVAMSANVAHEVVAHDQDVCDICVHIQAHSDADLPPAATHHEWLVDTHSDTVSADSKIFSDFFSSSGLIRGPPQLS